MFLGEVETGIQLISKPIKQKKVDNTTIQMKQTAKNSLLKWKDSSNTQTLNSKVLINTKVIGHFGSAMGSATSQN